MSSRVGLSGLLMVEQVPYEVAERDGAVVAGTSLGVVPADEQVAGERPDGPDHGAEEDEEHVAHGYAVVPSCSMARALPHR